MKKLYVPLFFLIVQINSCIVVDGPSKCKVEKKGSLGINDKLDLRIRGKGLKTTDIETLYVNQYVKGTNLGMLFKSDTINLVVFLYSTKPDDTFYYNIYLSKNISEDLQSKYYFRFNVNYDYKLYIPKISKEYTLTDWNVIDTSYTWPSLNRCDDDPLPNFNTIRYKMNGKDTGTFQVVTLEATP